LSVSWTPVDDALVDDAGLEELIAPFRTRMEERTAEVIGTATGAFEKADPEGTLDNFVADAMLWAARAQDSVSVHAAMANDGGLRAPINAGPITVGEVFELMPFENFVSVLEFSGFQMDSLAQQVAATDGEPLAEFTFTITEGRAVDVRVAGQPLNPQGRYRVATSDYLANGGGSWPQLWTPLTRRDLDLLIRDAIELYVREFSTIEPLLDGRIRMEVRP